MIEQRVSCLTGVLGLDSAQGTYKTQGAACRENQPSQIMPRAEQGVIEHLGLESPTITLLIFQ